MEEQEKALIAMSGGVDSSVAAYLMQEAGYHCIGATMRLYKNETISLKEEHTCCSLDDVKDARNVARQLGIPYHVFNFTDDFETSVIHKFISSYEAGLTPNPCVDCNRYMKFGHLLRIAEELGCSCIVTGHYSRIAYSPERDRWLLYRAAYREKDQSYVLYNLTQHQLAHTRFPLGELPKEDVRRIAEAQGFLNARKHDSQDICFVPDGDYAAFMERYTGKSYPAGDYLDLSGNIVGRHKGAIRYTLGQRKHLGLAMNQHVYVCAKDMSANTVTIGPESALFTRTVWVDDLNWISVPEPVQPMRVCAKTRYRQQEQPATVYPEANGKIRVVFDAGQRAVTPGQALVMYDGDLVVGGGTILATE